jgi:hypothetical protein
MLSYPACVVIFLCCVFLLFFAIRSWWIAEPRTVVAPEEVEEVSLKDLSIIWTRPIKEEISCFADLSTYRQGEAPVSSPAPERSRPVYRHKEIARFYREKVDCKPFFLKDIKECVEDILKLLDDEGDCPSVVRRNSREPEKGLKTNIYDMLAKIPLYRHSVNVAREIARACKQQAVVPKAVIAALAHDLGKIPSYQEKAYSTGDHPHIAPMVLGTLESFNKLPFAEDILEAVRFHHRPNPEQDLAQKLKDADQASRSKEIAAMLKAEGKRGSVETGQEDEEPPIGHSPEVPEDLAAVAGQTGTSPPAPPEEEPGSSPEEEIDANEAVFGSGGEVDMDIFGSEERGDERIVNRKVEIGWFEPIGALAYIQLFINRMKGGRFGAFSMPDGYVYVEADFFWKVAKKMSRGDPSLLVADSDIQTRRNIMFSMVDRLKKEANAIAGEFLGEGYFMARFILNPESDNPRELCFIPFLAQAFGEPVSILEARKIARLREIVKVVPKHQLPKEGDGAGSINRLYGSE